jgi:4-hydroxy-tetrahydrodipicolinate synthase
MDIAGVLPVLHLPYDADMAIDYAALACEVDWVFAQGVDGVVIAMASEIQRLSDAERDELAARLVEQVAGRGPVITSCGAEGVELACRHARAAAAAGVDGLMAVPPCLTACAADDIRLYYQAILDAVDLPLVIQDASGYVGNSIPLATLTQLLADNPDRVLFKPEAHPVGAAVSALRDATGGEAKMFEGLGGMSLVDTWQRGIVGTMPGSDMPWAIVALWRALQAGDLSSARQIQGPLTCLISMLHNLDAFIVTEKMLLCEQGIFDNERVRGPVGFVLDPDTRREILAIFAELRRVVDSGPAAAG